MKKYIAALLLSILCLPMFADVSTTYKEGDIIFIISKSKQSPMIQYATSSLWSHCGIVVYKKGEPYVLEASNVVKLTPLDEFNNKGRLGAIVQMRYTDKPVKIAYKKYLGKPYDLQFSLKNNRYYCSELVWLIYKEQLGVELCKPQPLSKYRTLGLGKVMKKRGISKKSLFVAPSDLLESEKLYGV